MGGVSVEPQKTKPKQTISIAPGVQSLSAQVSLIEHKLVLLESAMTEHHDDCTDKLKTLDDRLFQILLLVSGTLLAAVLGIFM